MQVELYTSVQVQIQVQVDVCVREVSEGCVLAMPRRVLSEEDEPGVRHTHNQQTRRLQQLH